MKNNDVQLIHRILDGDDTAFAELVEKYQKQVHALVWRKIGDFHIAEEITQDTFLKAYQRLATLKKPQRFASWLYVIATNRCSTWLRKKHLRRQLLEGMDSAQPEKVTYSEHVVVENEQITIETQRNVVKKLLAKLEESERTVMTLHYFGEMSCTEIGAFLGVSANTIKSRLHRAQQRLQKEESMIREALDNFKISPNLTETIMREISLIKPDAQSVGKPLVPWAVAASTLAVVLLMLGFGNSRYLTRFQEPYNFDATAEMKVDIIDAPIVANLESAPDVRTQIKNTNALAKLNDPEKQPNDDVATLSEETQMEETVKDYTQWELPKKAKTRLGKGGITGIQFSPDGKQLAVGSDIGVWLYDVNTGKEISLFPGICRSLAFSPDGRLLVNGGREWFYSHGDSRWEKGREVELWEITTGRKVTLSDAPPESAALRFSADRKTLVSLNKSRDTISRLDVKTGQRTVNKMGKRPGYVRLEVYALMQDKIAIGMDTGNIELWDTMTGEKLSTIKEYVGQLSEFFTFRGIVNNSVLTLAFSPDGKRLASASKDATLQLWDTTGNDESITLRKHVEGTSELVWTNALAFSTDGKIFASGGTDTTVQLWDSTTGESLATFTGHFSNIDALAFSPDGTTLASGSSGGSVLFWNIKTGQPLQTRITGHSAWVHAVTFYRGDSSTLASAADNGIITLWDLETSQKTTLQTKSTIDRKRFPYCFPYLSLTFSLDGTKLASSGVVVANSSEPWLDYVIRLTDVSNGRELATFPGGGSHLTFSPDGKIVAGTRSNGTIRLWNTEMAKTLDIPLSDPNDDPEKRHQPVFTTLTFSPDGKKLVSGTVGGSVQMWDVETGAELTSFFSEEPPIDHSYRDQIVNLAFSSDGSLLAVGSIKQVRLLGNLEQIALKEVTYGEEVWGEGLVFSPDDTILVIGLLDNRIELWDLTTGDKLTTLDGHTNTVETLVFSPDGKTLVSTGQDGTILLWDWDEVLKGLDQ